MSKTPVTEQQLRKWGQAYRDDPRRRLATLALSKTDLNDVCYSPADAFAMTRTFSIDIPTMRVTNQEKSGRCWLFAATNVLRERIAKQLGLENFELSQSYLAFWDKFERCNYFFENILETAALPFDDRNVSFLLATGVHDGGQWEMFANIVRKYGVVPKDVYGETFQSSHSMAMNATLNRHLKHCAVALRAAVARGAAPEELTALKEEMLEKIFAFLCSCYSEPPEVFDFSYRVKDGDCVTERGMTPKGFYEKYVGDLLDNTVSIINAPTADKPFHETYTVRYLGNIVGGRVVKHLNLTMDEFKSAVIAQLKDGKVVWFGSDVGKHGDREKGVWDDASYDAELLTGLDLSLTKAEGLDTGFSAMNHAMVITGVNLTDGKPDRWKIENSWGEDRGQKGYYVCSDTWFDKFVYQAAVEKPYLGELAAHWEKAPEMLEAWDPMGTLAR